MHDALHILFWFCLIKWSNVCDIGLAWQISIYWKIHSIGLSFTFFWAISNPKEKHLIILHYYIHGALMFFFLQIFFSWFIITQKCHEFLQELIFIVWNQSKKTLKTETGIGKISNLNIQTRRKQSCHPIIL